MGSDLNWLVLASWGFCPMIWSQDLGALGPKVGEECSTSEECQRTTPNSTCANGNCTCQTGFSILQRINLTSCEPSILHPDEHDKAPHSPGGSKHGGVDPKMIVIMVALAVMFLGICVALHLFSKARFRNYRSIFNSPHPRLMHIKLDKKKQGRRTSHASLEPPGSRQLSICSQLSPLQSRRVSPGSGRRPQSAAARDKKDGHGSLTGRHPDPATSSTSLPNNHQSKRDSQIKDTGVPDSPNVIVATGESHPSPPSPESSSPKKA